MDDLETVKAAKDVAVLQGYLPYVAREVEQALKAIDNRTYGMLDKGELTPEMALQAWMERNSYRKMLSQFNKRLAVSQNLAQSAKSVLEKGLPGAYTNRG